MIKHILADGTELKSIEGLVIPPTGKTEAVYRLIAGFSVNARLSAQQQKVHRQVEPGGAKEAG